MGQSFQINNVTVGKDSKCFIVAEISANHNGKIEKAIDIIKAAKNAGADAVKLQTYTPDSITLNSVKDDFLLPKDSPWSLHSNFYELYSKASTPLEWHQTLFEEAKKIGIIIFSSPFDESSVEFLENLNAPAYKIASPEITHIPLIKRVAITNKPIIISTGVCDYKDLKLAIDTIKKLGNDKICVLKCTSSYPAPLKEANLKTIADYSKEFNVLSGLSDHTLDNISSIIATAMGASLIEKHIKLDEDDDGVDSFFSLTPNQFKIMVENIRLSEQSIGKVSYNITSSAKKSINGRRSIYVSNNIEKGEVFSHFNIKVVRPSFGLHPKYFHDIIGMKSSKKLTFGDRLTWDAVEK
jgi:pseudaminic acid synthase